MASTVDRDHDTAAIQQRFRVLAVRVERGLVPVAEAIDLARRLAPSVLDEVVSGQLLARQRDRQGNTPVQSLRYSRGRIWSVPSEPEGPGARVRERTLRRLVMALISETLRCEVWEAKARSATSAMAGLPKPVVLLPRPVELADVASLKAKGTHFGTIVYPDPPIDAAEQQLIDAVSCGFHISSLATVSLP